MSVFHSLVIPTRNRQSYVIDAVAYYLRDIDIHGEVIVADNSDNKFEILSVLKPFLFDKRLKILPSLDHVLSMKENWERAVSKSSGQWVSFIGDDDILSPDLIFFIQHFLKTVPNADKYEAFKWKGINFSWAGVNVDGRRNPACIPVMGDQVKIINCSDHLEHIMSWGSPNRSCGSGPSIYHGLWRRSLIDKVKKLHNGFLFDASIIDYESGYNAMISMDCFVFIERPFSILGACEKSNSAAVIDYKKKAFATTNWLDEGGMYEGVPEGLNLPVSLALTIYFLNKFWMKKVNYKTEVNMKNVVEGLAKELVTIDPDFFDVFKDQIISFMKQTEFVDYLEYFQPKKRERHVVGWNGYLSGQIVIDPSNYADRVIQFADIAFSLVTPWQRVGSLYKIDPNDI